MSYPEVQIDDLYEGDRVLVELHDGEVFSPFEVTYGGYEKRNACHCLVFYMDGSEMLYETQDVTGLFLIHRNVGTLPPVAEASCDFDPDELGEDYPC